MKNFPRALGAVSLAAILGLSSSAVFAQPGGRSGERDDHRRPHVQQPRGPQAYRHAGPPQRPAPHHMQRDGGHRDGGYRDPRHASNGHRGAGPQHNWYRGARVPPAYRGHNYVVNDWRGHRLSAPPRGYHWIQNGPDYLLVAVGSGVIAQLILSN